MTIKMNAEKKAKELAEIYGGKVEEYGEYGYVIEVDENTMRKVAVELDLEILVDDGPGNCFSAQTEYPEAGDEGVIFADLGGFQHEDRCLIGVSYSCL